MALAQKLMGGTGHGTDRRAQGTHVTAEIPTQENGHDCSVLFVCMIVASLSGPLHFSLSTKIDQNSVTSRSCQASTLIPGEILHCVGKDYIDIHHTIPAIQYKI